MRRWLLVAGLAWVSGCSALSCETPLQREERELGQASEGVEAVIYRGLKVSIRSAPVEELNDDGMAEHAADGGDTVDPAARVRRQMRRLLATLSRPHDEGRPAELSPREYFELAAAFVSLRSELREVDEDAYPTLYEQLAVAQGQRQDPEVLATLQWYNSAWEHLALAAIWVFSQKAPQGFAFYELGQLNPEELQVPSTRALSRIVRGVAFLSHGWPYLTEREMSAYLDDLAANSSAIVEFGRSAARSDEPWTDEQVFAQWHSVGVLLRGAARMSKGEEFEDDMLLDFEAFLVDAETLGVDVEVTWLLGAYVGIKRGDSARALPPLRKLSESELFPEAERQLFRDAAAAMEGRDPEAAFRSIGDRYLVVKVVAAYAYRVVMRVNWRQQLEATESGRALLRAEGVIDEEVRSIQNAMSPEQLSGFGEGAVRVGRGIWHDLERRIREWSAH